jgi:anti-sigma factor RsiW
MAACSDREALLNGLLDGELDAANTAAIEAHIAACHDCREAFARLQGVRDMLNAPGVRHQAPAELRASVEAAIGDSPAPNRKTVLPSWLVPGAVGALAASLAMMLFTPLSTVPSIEDEAVSGHIRSLQVAHLTDVQTSNQHVVKPWFNGKIDFSPPVPELAAQGFPLAGGRLDYIGGRSVAAIVYHRRLHTINLFVWPAPGPDRTVATEGYSVTEWSRGGLRFVAVSDIGAGDLNAFKTAFIASTR